MCATEEPPQNAAIVTYGDNRCQPASGATVVCTTPVDTVCYGPAAVVPSRRRAPDGLSNRRAFAHPLNERESWDR